MLPSASALGCRREERVQKAFSVDHHGPGNARLSHRAVGSRRRVKRLCGMHVHVQHHIVAFCAMLALWLRRASPASWWSTEKAFWTRSSRLLAKAEALGSTDYKSTVDVDDRSTGGNRLEALSRPRTAGCSETSDRGGQS